MVMKTKSDYLMRNTNNVSALIALRVHCDRVAKALNIDISRADNESRYDVAHESAMLWNKHHGRGHWASLGDMYKALSMTGSDYKD